METIAVLDEKNRLVGYKEVEKAAEEEVVFPNGGDLPIDGTYEWGGKSFAPLGHNYGKPNPLPNGVDMHRAIYLALKALMNGQPIPNEVSLWIEWYENNLKQRNEELELVKKKRGG